MSKRAARALKAGVPQDFYKVAPDTCFSGFSTGLKAGVPQDF
tara:strand:- start:2117 stop:2242 length:126 start_codon:yes stop_codon:yes gene_type:complete